MKKYLLYIKQQIEHIEQHGINYPILTIHVTPENKDFWLKILEIALKEIEHENNL